MTSFEQSMCWRNAIYWTQAIVYQGARTISAHERARSSLPPSLARLEEQFFLNACEKAVRNVQALRNEGQDESIRNILPTDALRDFIKKMDSTGIRNLREHEDEYLKTGGRSQDDELVDASRPEGELKIVVGPGITVKRDGDIIIGGRLSVRETMQLAQELSDQLVPAQHDYERSKSEIMANADVEAYPYVFLPSKID